jgi:hypothetical protein
MVNFVGVLYIPELFILIERACQRTRGTETEVTLPRLRQRATPFNAQTLGC